jgi:hypothetical protein
MQVETLTGYSRTPGEHGGESKGSSELPEATVRDQGFAAYSNGHLTHLFEDMSFVPINLSQ